MGFWKASKCGVSGQARDGIFKSLFVYESFERSQEKERKLGRLEELELENKNILQKLCKIVVNYLFFILFSNITSNTILFKSYTIFVNLITFNRQAYLFY